jgi:hypothetical protein
MIKISACAVVAAAVAAIVATSPASAAAQHRAAAHRAHSRAVVVDPNGLRAIARVPEAEIYAPTLNGGGSEGYNAGLRIN